jgi:hypothetical protein
MTTYTATPAAMHSGHDIRDERGSMVAIVHNPAADPAEGARIAALMAAAPELLEFIQCVAYDVATPSWVVKLARAAIARATGAV